MLSAVRLCASGPNGHNSPGHPSGETQITAAPKRLLFELFLLSGFCGLLYQVVWVRLAFASFGIISAVISVVLSVFMLGLALGSWAGGRLAEAFRSRSRHSVIYLYAAAELIIGAGAFAVPPLFGVGESLLHQLGEANSFAYLFLSAVCIAAAIFPWCVAMGATFPLVMGFVREEDGAAQTTFSYLYVANVLGACAGALVTAGILVELLGFRQTLWLAGSVNVVIAFGALSLGIKSTRRGARPPMEQEAAPPVAVRAIPWTRTILFTTGLASLAMEVIWTRAFSPVLGTQVYAFAALLAVYLVGTWMGSAWYRRRLAAGNLASIGQVLAVLALSSLLPVVLNDPRVADTYLARASITLASILPLCVALGYLTPRLIDEYSGGDPRRAGSAYALNVLGCILGPLIASYLMLPFLGAALSLAILALPLLAFACMFRHEIALRPRWTVAVACAALLGWSVGFAKSFENPCSWLEVACEVRRDYAATVVSLGEGMKRRMLVNGVGITELTPITKFMAHLPLAFHPGEAKSALVICFGMGTTYRSLLSWNVRTTAVELVPSVRDAFPYFHADASAVLRNPNGRIVIDDGRRFLNRSRETFDVIVVDPPPPLEAAGSSLLYSREFHEAVRDHLNPGGVFQTWFPGGEGTIALAIARSLRDVFPHVRVYRSIEGWGLHFIASMQPLEDIGPDRMLARLSVEARSDLSEWTQQGLDADVRKVLSQEVPIESVLPKRNAVRVTDDRPFNEYYLVRRLLAPRPE